MHPSNPPKSAPQASTDWLDEILANIGTEFIGGAVAVNHGELYEAKHAILAHLDDAVLAGRIAAYADCGSKGGDGHVVRGYAKSRVAILQRQQRGKA